MDEIIQILIASLERGEFYKNDKKQIKHLLKEGGFSAHDLNVARSKMFDMVRDQLVDPNLLSVVNWLEEVNKTLLPNVDEEKVPANECYFSPGNDCENAIISAIRKAKSTIKICVFTISENEISEALIRAHKRGINIKIITDNDKINDTGSDIRWLLDEGLTIRIDEATSHMHHKFCIVDKKILLTGSYNWTKSAADRNQENILITYDPKSVKLYLREFEQLWDLFPAF